MVVGQNATMSMQQRLVCIAGILQRGLKCLLRDDDDHDDDRAMPRKKMNKKSYGKSFERMFRDFLSALMVTGTIDSASDSASRRDIDLPCKDRFLLYHRILSYCLHELNTAAAKHSDHASSNSNQNCKLYMDAFVFVLGHLSKDTLQSIVHHGRLGSNTVGSLFLSPIECDTLHCLKSWMWSRNQLGASDAFLLSSCRDTVVVQLLQVCNHIILFHQDCSIAKIFQGHLAVIVLGVDMQSCRSLVMVMVVEQCFGLKEEYQKKGQEDARSNVSENRNVWRWYFDLFKNFMTCFSWKEESKCEGNETRLDEKRHLLQQQPWKYDAVKVILGREYIYIQNILEMLAMSNTWGTTDEKKQMKLWFLLILGRLLDPMWVVDYGSSVDGSGNISRELFCIMSLSSLVAKGVDVLSIVCGNRSMEIETIAEENKEEEDDNDDDENDNEQEKHCNQGADERRSNRSVPFSHKLRRQDLQTISKLDRLYKFNLTKAQSDMMGWLREQPLDFATQMCEISMKIGRGDVITQVIPVIFDASNPNDYREEETENFCTILSCLLQNCCGARARDSAVSPLLSTLAFRSGFLKDLWHYTKQRVLFYNDIVRGNNAFTVQSSRESVRMYSAVTSFCDMFSHQLLAIDDEEFIGSFTVAYHHDKDKGGILVTEVICMLKNLLYDLYWSKPVIAADFTILQSRTTFECTDIEKFHRARLLLSGTKLWNSIYTRWSRLFRTFDFCDEESWWFPHLVTRHDDESGAMDHRTASMNQEMDEEEDESMGSIMEVDENAHVEGQDESEALASSFKDPKMARILSSIPQALPFERRAKLFSSLLGADIAKTQDESAAMREMMWNMQQGIEGAEYRGREKVRIRRDELYNDSMFQISELARRLKKKVQVTFISKHGNEEAGVDGGGLFKEFLDDLIKEAFNPQISRDGIVGPLFIETPLQTLAVNTNLGPSPLALSHYRFLGRVLGKAVYESILVEPQFCLPFLNQLLGQHNTVDDLKNIDPIYHKHLCSLRKMSGEEIASLGLTFELTVSSSDGTSSRSIELVPGGSSLPVTGENVIRYIHLVAHRRLNIETARQANEFLSGFRDLIPASWVRLFSPYELQKVISGDNTVNGFDVKGLKSVMLYGGGYHPSQPIIQWFWQIVDEMTATQKSKLLKFMTSCSRQPLLGFGHLSPLPCIHQVRVQEDEEQRLPTSATCMHLLKLPNYRSKSILKEKLLYAIESGAGFELS